MLLTNSIYISLMEISRVQNMFFFHNIEMADKKIRKKKLLLKDSKNQIEKSRISDKPNKTVHIIEPLVLFPRKKNLLHVPNKTTLLLRKNFNVTLDKVTIFGRVLILSKHGTIPIELKTSQINSGTIRFKKIHSKNTVFNCFILS